MHGGRHRGYRGFRKSRMRGPPGQRVTARQYEGLSELNVHAILHPIYPHTRFFSAPLLYLFFLPDLSPKFLNDMNRSSITLRNIDKNRPNSHDYDKRGTRSPQATSTRSFIFVKPRRNRMLIIFAMSVQSGRRRWLGCPFICGRRFGDDSF